MSEAADELRVAGVPVGREIERVKVWGSVQTPTKDAGMGSIIIVEATDAPLMPNQLQRLAKRAAIGLARTGATVADGDGDIFIAFSTRCSRQRSRRPRRPSSMQWWLPTT
jgi:D-aminopeptidase